MKTLACLWGMHPFCGGHRPDSSWLCFCGSDVHASAMTAGVEVPPTSLPTPAVFGAAEFGEVAPLFLIRDEMEQSKARHPSRRRPRTSPEPPATNG